AYHHDLVVFYIMVFLECYFRIVLLSLCFFFYSFFFFFNDTATTEIYTLSLHDALPISVAALEGLEGARAGDVGRGRELLRAEERSEEHTSELQSRFDLVCRLLLEKKKKKIKKYSTIKKKKN